MGTITNDPLFGTTMATIYTELKPTGFPFNLFGKPADRTLDSIVFDDLKWVIESFKKDSVGATWKVKIKRQRATNINGE